MKRNVYYIATLFLAVVLTACGKSKSSNEQQAADTYDYRVIETAPVYADTLKKDSSANASPKAKISVPPTNMKMDLMTAMRNSLSCYQQLYEELTS